MKREREKHSGGGALADVSSMKKPANLGRMLHNWKMARHFTAAHYPCVKVTVVRPVGLRAVPFFHTEENPDFSSLPRVPTAAAAAAPVTAPAADAGNSKKTEGAGEGENEGEGESDGGVEDGDGAAVVVKDSEEKEKKEKQKKKKIDSSVVTKGTTTQAKAKEIKKTEMEEDANVADHTAGDEGEEIASSVRDALRETTTAEETRQRETHAEAKARVSEDNEEEGGGGGGEGAAEEEESGGGVGKVRVHDLAKLSWEELADRMVNKKTPGSPTGMDLAR